MEKSLVIVESPAKARTINKFLGKDYVVKASMGHVKDLPSKSLAVDIERDFTPHYEIIKGKEKILAELKKAAKNSKAIYLAADPDREGEAICWHLAHELKASKRPIHRVTFHEITQRAVREAFANPGPIDERKVEAQQARRILDRLVGYQISPLLWEKVRRGLSAGRVQSVALRLIVDREQEIRAFVPEEYWTIEALLRGHLPPAFKARLVKINGEKASIGSEEEARRIVEELERQPFQVADISRRERQRSPAPPFTTSTLQQEAARKLRFTASKTMQIAQQLYEGIELGKEGAVGLITYMRTDSTRIAPEAQSEARRFITDRFGQDFVPERPPVYKSAKMAQEAHEAIRPTSVFRDPASVRRYLTRDQLALYTLIWNRFVASQMPPAVYDVTTVDIRAGRFTLRASGRVLKFPGFTRLYIEGEDEAPKTKPEEAREEAEEELPLPPLEVGEVLQLLHLDPEQHFTQPPPRYTEASLVKELEQRGIGRPSTYATILSIIQNRDYVVKEEGKFKPTELGELVVELLLKSFPQIMDYDFTARMESTLDEVEEGKVSWLDEMRRFYANFSQWLERARVTMENVKALEEKTEEACDKCGSPMVIKWGRFGRFLACSAYPECKNAREIPGNNGASSKAAEEAEEGRRCEKCGRPMVVKRGRFGPFLSCSGYPECRNVVKLEGGKPPETPPVPTGETCEKCGGAMVYRDGRYGRFKACSAYPTCRNIKPIPLDVNCPQCGSPLTARRTKRGKVFYGCSGYPTCNFAVWERPVPQPCPTCGAPFLVQKTGKGQRGLGCIAEGCGYVEEERPLRERRQAR